jgi:uncharacterized protein
MRLGILSDSHGRLILLQRLLTMLSEAGATYFIHCGDLADFGHSLVPILRALPTGRSAFVFGNADIERSEAALFASSHDLLCLDIAGRVELDGRVIDVVHGDDGELLMSRFEVEPLADYLLSGHTHIPHDLQRVRPRRINPGAIYEPRQRSRAGGAVLDLSTGELQFVHL